MDITNQIKMLQAQINRLKSSISDSASTQVVFDESFRVNTDFTKIDTGVVINDGDEIEATISSEKGHFGTVVNPANIPELIFIDAQGNSVGGLWGQPIAGTGILNGVSRFRFMMHEQENYPEYKTIFPFPLMGDNQITDVWYTTGTRGAQVDDATQASTEFQQGNLKLSTNMARMTLMAEQFPLTLGIYTTQSAAITADYEVRFKVRKKV